MTFGTGEKMSMGAGRGRDGGGIASELGIPLSRRVDGGGKEVDVGVDDTLELEAIRSIWYLLKHSSGLLGIIDVGLGPRVGRYSA